MIQRAKSIKGTQKLRVVHVHATESSRSHAVDAKEFCSNQLVTSKFTLTTFVPHVLLRQFSSFANLYFLMIAVLQLIPRLSASSWITTVVPLIFVLVLNATKAALEDIRQHRSDKEINTRTAEVLVGDAFMIADWSNVIVGDIVRVRDGSEFPADIVLLFSSDLQGIAYVETASLDGETNLKMKNAFYRSRSSNPEDDDMSLLALTALVIKCELPNNRLYEFDGAISLQGQGLMALDVSQILLRGSTLRNTRWIVGAVVYTGADTKCILNMISAKTKTSQLERRMNGLVMGMFILQISVCIGLAIGESVWLTGHDFHYYISNPSQKRLPHAITQIFRFVSLLNQAIPISLYVTLELVKVIQCYFIQWDLQMYHKGSDTPAQTRSVNLIEELGQVQYVLSDKTGTLTQNVMAFVRCSIGGVVYGAGVDEASLGQPHTLHTVSRDEGLCRVLSEEEFVTDPHTLKCKMFFLHLAICHQVVPDVDATDIKYHAASPDEEALVYGAASCGYQLLERTVNEIVVKCEGSKLSRHTILAVLEFTSDRKRMSIICKDSEGRVKLYCKGADTVVLKRLSKHQDASVAVTIQHLEKFACAGFRTLCIAERELDQDEYERWASRFLAASVALDEREEKLALLADYIERELVLLGVTAVEDKLQDGVPETVTLLSQAGMKVWVLTGDKLETAVSIGLTCNLLVDSIHLFLLADTCAKSIAQMLINMLEEAHSKKKAAGAGPFHMAVVIEGASLAVALEEHNKPVFLKLCQMCRTVICCRVSPFQKARVVRMLKQDGAVTLAIGDGANDMAMMQAAHVGVGISGVSGRQTMTAVVASNYAIAQFCFLGRLLLVHGRWSYKRNRDLIMYAFYKNIVYVAANCYHAFHSAYSAQPLHNAMLISTYNLLWTALPVIGYAILNQDLKDKTILNNPQLYKETQNDKRWRFFKSFLLWVGVAIWHSVVTFYLSAYAVPTGTYNRVGLFGVATTSYTMAVGIVNLKLASRITSFTWILVIFLCWSFGMWVLFLFILSFFWKGIRAFPELTGIGSELCNSRTFWLIILLACTTAFIPDIMYAFFRRQLYPNDTEILQEMEHGWRGGVRSKSGRVSVVEQVTKSKTVRAVSLPKEIIQQFEQANSKLSPSKTMKMDPLAEPLPRRITWRDVLSEKEIEDIDIPDTLSRYGKRRSSGFQVCTTYSDDEEVPGTSSGGGSNEK